MARARTAAAGAALDKAPVLDTRKDVPPLVGHTFGQSGRLLGRSEPKEGSGELPLPDLKEPVTLKVVVGRPIDRPRTRPGGDRDWLRRSCARG